MILVAAILRLMAPKGPNAFLLLAVDAAPETVRLSKVDLQGVRPCLLWRRRILTPGSVLIDAEELGDGRILLLAASERGTTVRSVRAADGASVSPWMAVDGRTVSLGRLAGLPTLVSAEAKIAFVRPLRGVLKDARNSYGGSLVRNGVAYAFSSYVANGSTTGFLTAVRIRGSSLEETYRTGFAPGPFALALSGDRLVVLQNEGQMQIYNVAIPEHPRLAAWSYPRELWKALATSASGESFYALESRDVPVRESSLQSYRIGPGGGLVPASDAATVRNPKNPQELKVIGSFVFIFDRVGGFGLFHTSGTAIMPVSEGSVGVAGPWVVGSDSSRILAR